MIGSLNFGIKVRCHIELWKTELLAPAKSKAVPAVREAESSCLAALVRRNDNELEMGIEVELRSTGQPGAAVPT